MELHWIRLFFAFFPTRISPSLPLPFIGSFSVLRTNRAITREAFFGPVLDRCFVLFFYCLWPFEPSNKETTETSFFYPQPLPSCFFLPPVNENRILNAKTKANKESNEKKRKIIFFKKKTIANERIRGQRAAICALIDGPHSASHASARCFMFRKKNLTGKQVGRHLLFAALRSDRRQTDGGHLGSQKPQENGRRWSLG